MIAEWEEYEGGLNGYDDAGVRGRSRDLRAARRDALAALASLRGS